MKSSRGKSADLYNMKGMVKYMNPALGVLGFWIGFILLVLSYLLRKKKSGKPLLQMAAAAFFISVIMFLWWALLRNFS